MAASLNKVFLMGNLTRDPELRYVPSGTAVANFTVAVNRTYKSPSGEKKEDASFIRVIVWGKIAEICGEYLSKGRPVLVEGRLQSRSWEGQDGQKKSALEVVASSVQFLGGRPDRDERPRAEPQGAAGKSGNEGGYGNIESIDVDQPSGEEDVPF